MLATIEAYYDNGKITSTENIGIKSGRVLLTILEPLTPKTKQKDISKLSGTINLSKSPLQIQKSLRDEWK
jgi:hypothetical protein